MQALLDTLTKLGAHFNTIHDSYVDGIIEGCQFHTDESRGVVVILDNPDIIDIDSPEDLEEWFYKRIIDNY